MDAPYMQNGNEYTTYDIHGDVLLGPFARYRHIAHITVICRNSLNSSNRDPRITRQLCYEHTFRQNVLSTKNRYSLYFLKNTTCLAFGILRNGQVFCILVKLCSVGLRQTACFKSDMCLYIIARSSTASKISIVAICVQLKRAIFLDIVVVCCHTKLCFPGSNDPTAYNHSHLFLISLNLDWSKKNFPTIQITKFQVFTAVIVEITGMWHCIVW